MFCFSIETWYGRRRGMNVFVCCDKTASTDFLVMPRSHTHTRTHTHFQTHLQSSPDLRPVAAVEHSEKEWPVGPLGARKVLCSSVCVLVHACVRVSVCVCAVAEGDPRGPASYSLSAGDHHFHKTSIVGTELQTPETHWKQLQCTHTHTHTQKYIHTGDKTVRRLKRPIPAEIMFC